MLKRFPFGDILMKNLGIFQPEKTSSDAVNTMLGLANRFPQLRLSDSESLDCLKEEFTDVLLSPGDVTPLISTYEVWEPSFNPPQTAEKVKKPHAGSFWWKVGQMKTMDDKKRFPLLFKLMSGLLSFPSSDADSERGFSVLKKIHTDQRSNLDHSTIISLSH